MSIATGPTPSHYMLRGVNLFASGEYRGQTWAPAVIDNMARAGKSLGPSGEKLHTPPAAPGHEDDDGWHEFVATDEPAAGWVDPDSLRSVPDPKHPGHKILVGDVVNVPRAMAQKIESGEYRYGSAEIYDDFTNDFGKRFGKVLRKFSYLGGEVPQVKRLGPLPKPVPMAAPKRFSERPGVVIHERTVRRGGTSHTYAETTVMDRQSMLAAIQAAMPGISQTTLDALQDEQLADLVKNLPTPGAATPAAPTTPAAPVAGLFAEEPTREEMIAALTDMGEDPDELDAMEDDELGALYDEAMSEDEEPDTDTDTETEEVETMADPTLAADPMAGAAAAPTREEMIAELVAQGQDAAQLDAMTDDELKALFTQLTGGAEPAAPAAPAATMGERRNRGGRALMSETNKVARTARRLNNAMEAELNRFRVASHRQKTEDAQTFCDRLVADGKATPAMVQAAILPALLNLDNSRAVHRFTENGRTRTLTAYEVRKSQLAKLPVTVKFGERFPASAGPKASTDEAEAAKVREFAETIPETALKASGYKSREQFVSKFAELRKKDPELTAQKYLGK